ncbi:MAG: hypothetical protein JO353_06145, partial [Phycisphaerae bacterium]|nr:hypothetical protein [Phycisphaerae bacterium]
TVIVHYTEHGLLNLSVTRQIEQQDADQQIAHYQADIADLKSQGAQERSSDSTRPSTFADSSLRVDEASLAHSEQVRGEITDSFATWHRVAYVVDTPLPKTTQTYELIQRIIGERMRLHPRHDRPEEEPADPRRQRFFHEMQLARRAEQQTQQIESTRSSAYIVGTSLVFEAVITAWAAWLFWRRDF